MDPTYGAINIPDDCWGVDAAMLGALSYNKAKEILTTPLPNKKMIKVVTGYIPLPGNKSSWDMTASSLRMWMDLGAIVTMVQHCYAGTVIATAQQGTDLGKYAAEYVSLIGYAKDAHVSLDDEAIGNSGLPVFQRCENFCRQLLMSALPCIYEGYEPGLTPLQFWEIPDVSRYWGAYGPWDVAVRSVCCRQSLQITHCGVPMDPDHYFKDRLGGVMRGMCRTDLQQAA